MFKAINEHALSSLNYQIGVLKLEANGFKEIDESIRQVLMNHKIHLQPGCKERLYFPREYLGRGLLTIEHKSETILLQLSENLTAREGISKRRATIMKVEKDNKTHLSVIQKFLEIRYEIEGTITQEKLKEAQFNTLISEINSKAHRYLECAKMSWPVLKNHQYGSNMETSEQEKKLPIAICRIGMYSGEKNQAVHTVTQARKQWIIWPRNTTAC